jgi:hypothetical protein
MVSGTKILRSRAFDRQLSSVPDYIRKKAIFGFLWLSRRELTKLGNIRDTMMKV